MSKLPSDWTLVSLSDCCVEKGKYGANAPAIEYSDRLPRYVRITDLTDNGRLHEDTKMSIDLAGNEEHVLQDNDFLFARSGATVGKTYLYKARDGLAIYAGYLIKFHPDESTLMPEYLKHFTQSDMYRQWVEATIRAGAQPNINATEYGHLTIPLPPLPEQRKIAAILSTWDEAITLVDKLIAALKRRKQALMQLLLTGEVRFPGFEEEWEEVEVQEIAEINKEILGEKISPEKEFFYIDLSAVNQGRIDLPQTKTRFRDLPSRARRVLRKGDVMMATVRPNLLGFAVADFDPIDLICSTGFALISPHNLADSQFIYQSLYSAPFMQQVQDLVTGSNYPAINASEVKKLILQYPRSSRERDKIASVLRKCDTENRLYSDISEHFRQQKRGLMQQLLTGAIRVQGEA